MGARFQVCFTPLAGVLFTFPSRYLSTIGHHGVLSLGGWAPRIRAGFHVSRPTWDPARGRRGFGYGAFTPSGRPFQAVPLPLRPPWWRSRNPGRQAFRFGLVRFRSPLLAESRLISLPPGTEMFHFPGSRSRRPIVFGRGCRPMTGGGLPHSDTHGSKRVCRSPWLVAAYRVLLRLPVPRHPSCARIRLAEDRNPRQSRLRCNS